MHDESVRQPFQGDFPLTCHLLVAGAALISLDALAGDHAFQRPSEGAPVLDLQAKAVEVLWSPYNVATAFADGQSCSLALEGALYEILLRSVLQCCLEAVKPKVDELLRILLGPYTRGPAAEVFERVAEVCWRILLPVAHLEEREQSDKLVQQGIVEMSSILGVDHVLWFPVVRGQQ